MLNLLHISSGINAGQSKWKPWDSRQKKTRPFPHPSDAFDCQHFELSTSILKLKHLRLRGGSTIISYIASTLRRPENRIRSRPIGNVSPAPSLSLRRARERYFWRQIGARASLGEFWTNGELIFPDSVHLIFMLPRPGWLWREDLSGKGV